MPEPSCVTRVIASGLSVAQLHFCGNGTSRRCARACGTVFPDPFPFLQAQEKVQRVSPYLCQKGFCRAKVQSLGQRLIRAFSPISKGSVFWCWRKVRAPKQRGIKISATYAEKSDEVLSNFINVIKTQKIPLENFTQAFPSRCILLMAWKTQEEKMERNQASLKSTWTES